MEEVLALQASAPPQATREETSGIQSEILDGHPRSLFERLI